MSKCFGGNTHFGGGGGGGGVYRKAILERAASLRVFNYVVLQYSGRDSRDDEQWSDRPTAGSKPITEKNKHIRIKDDSVHLQRTNLPQFVKGQKIEPT